MDDARTPPPTTLGWIDLWLLTVVVTWAVNFRAAQLAGRLADGARLDPRTLIVLRMALVVPVLVPLAAKLGRRSIGEIFAMSRRDFVILAGLAFAAIPCNQFLFVWGMQHTSSIHGALLFATSPALASLLAQSAGIERTGKRVWWGMAIAFLGVALVVSRSTVAPGATRSDADPGLLGDALILASATSWAIYAAASAPVLGRRSAIELTALTMSFGLVWTVILFGNAVWRDLAGGGLSRLTPSGIGGILYIAYLGALYGWVVWTVGIARIGSTRTMLYQYLVPLLSMVLGVAFFGEHVEARAVAGAGMILAGVALGRRG
ncbi:MAG: DMT family transporter [bacterium]